MSVDDLSPRCRRSGDELLTDPHRYSRGAPRARDPCVVVEESRMAEIEDAELSPRLVDDLTVLADYVRGRTS
ncbi:hypothetical protein FHR81_004732 [Actinoalloteichus hoggarensis]|uniref:Uncharacterized protein n=1 Tax=Actinoalloteichus hoggarensis TaxID=1470176 RepID=A0A221W420_9PSEU|nr:hypothetical protein AHOG_14895 [Actinoalloteichus hoggarensis]MBB5923661.1 hypothetical protein [Actinoalloteichus hoggarensis]